MNNLIFSVFPDENFVDLGVYQFGRETCSPAHSFGPTSRNHYLFHYVLTGTGKLMAQDSKGVTQEYQVKSGQGFMIFPRQITTYIADEHLPWEYIWIEFDGLRAKEIIEICGLSPDKPIYHALKKDLQENMKNEMMYIVEHRQESSLHLIGHLYLFIDYLARSIVTTRLQSQGKVKDFYIKEALNYIEQNFQNDISIEDIAVFCGLNRTYFGRIFKESIGKSPQEFLINYRMVKATELLKLTDLSVSDIGNAVGYINQLHFSRAFKKIYGISPREWRNKNRLIKKDQPASRKTMH